MGKPGSARASVPRPLAIDSVTGWRQPGRRVRDMTARKRRDDSERRAQSTPRYALQAALSGHFHSRHDVREAMIREAGDGCAQESCSSRRSCGRRRARRGQAGLSRVAAIAVIANPFAGKLVEDLSPLFDIGMRLGEELMPKAVTMLDGKPVSYGKAAIVGVNGDLEHAPAVLHPKLGKPMRQAVGGGEAIILEHRRSRAAGATLDVPLANKDKHLVVRRARYDDGVGGGCAARRTRSWW